MFATRAVLTFALTIAAATPVFADPTDDPFTTVTGGIVSEVKAAPSAGANPNAHDEPGATPVHGAANHNPEPSVIAALIEDGADPGARAEGGWTPLHLAAWKNPEPRVVVALIEGGANPNVRAGRGWTPLHLAAWKNPEPRVVVALIEGGADPNARDDDGRTPFDYAKDNEALRGTDAYRRLNEARFE